MAVEGVVDKGVTTAIAAIALIKVSSTLAIAHIGTTGTVERVGAGSASRLQGDQLLPAQARAIGKLHLLHAIRARRQHEIDLHLIAAYPIRHEEVARAVTSYFQLRRGDTRPEFQNVGV